MFRVSSQCDFDLFWGEKDRPFCVKCTLFLAPLSSLSPLLFCDDDDRDDDDDEEDSDAILRMVVATENTTTTTTTDEPSSSSSSSKTPSVVVHLRARPASDKGEGCVLVTNEGPRGSVLVKCRDRRMPPLVSLAPAPFFNTNTRDKNNNNAPSHQPQHASFQFTGNVLREASNDEVFDAVAKEAVEAATDGFNATILAYGQTGSGKTYTMGSGDGSYENRGVIPRALTMVFERLAVGERSSGKEAKLRTRDHHVMEEAEMLSKKKKQKPTAKVLVSFVEIYNENLIDLLSSHENPNHAPACVISDSGPDSGVFVRGLTTKEVCSEDEALALWFEGDAQRAIGSHAMNDRSSRSHAVFTLNIETVSFKNKETSSSSSATLHRSKIHLVDLAGSERLQKTRSSGTVMREATFINKSLSVLERVIISLGERNQSNRIDHVPYRSSKLTHLLRDALGGNCKTVMVAHVSSDHQHAEETLTTCQLAKRMMRVENNAKLNVCVETPSEKLTRLEREIKKLRAELKLLKSNAAASKKSANAGHEKSTQGEEQNDNYLVTRVQGEDEYGRGEGEEEAEEACSAADAASEDDGSISSRSYETSRLNDEARAYDEFKQTNGREKVKELSNAKAALRACKHRVRALSERVNEIKREMDATEKEHEKRRIECLETETKTGISYDDHSKREMKLEKEIASEEEQNDNPDIIAHRVVDEVIADTVRAALQDDTGKQTNEQCETNEDNGKVAKQEEEKCDKEELHALLRPLKTSYRAAFDQLVSAKNSLKQAELVVSDLSAKLHDAFVSFWNLQKKDVKVTDPSRGTVATIAPDASLLYAQLTQQWALPSKPSSSASKI